MTKNSRIAAWTIAVVLFIANAMTPIAAQATVNEATLVTSLGAQVEKLAARTKPSDWELIRACLYYALAGQYLLAQHGVHAAIGIGAIVYNPGTPAHHQIVPHAWLETADLLVDYSTLPRLGKTTVIPRELVADHPENAYPGVTRALALHRPAGNDLINYLVTHRTRFDRIINGDERAEAGR